MELSYISENGKPKKLLMFQKLTSWLEQCKNPTLKMFLIFREMELSSPKLKKIIFQEKTCKA